MQIGFALPTAGSWATPATMVHVARRAEALGYTSLWTFQRLLYPADAEWAPVYRSVHDPVVVLAHVAAVTERVRLGLAVVNMPFYAPIVLAKALTTLDAVADGRLDVGLGLGWSPEEFTAVGVPHERRGARAEEFLTCLRAIWADGVVDFAGEFYRVPPAHVDPKPVQRPGPPVLLGGAAQPSLRRAGRLGDGWISSSGTDLATIGSQIAVIRDAAAEAGRSPAALRFVVRGVLRIREGGAENRRPLTGSVEEVRADLADLAEQGVTEVFLDLNFDPEIGSPDADPATSARRAENALEAFAPGGG